MEVHNLQQRGSKKPAHTLLIAGAQACASLAEFCSVSLSVVYASALQFQYTLIVY